MPTGGRNDDEESLPSCCTGYDFQSGVRETPDAAIGNPTAVTPGGSVIARMRDPQPDGVVPERPPPPERVRLESVITRKGYRGLETSIPLAIKIRMAIWRPLTRLQIANSLPHNQTGMPGGRCVQGNGCGDGPELGRRFTVDSMMAIRNRIALMSCRVGRPQISRGTCQDSQLHSGAS